MLKCYETQHDGKTYKGHRVAAKKNCFFCSSKILADTFYLVPMAILSYTLGICKGDYSATSYGTENLFSFSLRGRMELLKYVYFYAQKSIIKAGNSKFQDLINAPRTRHIVVLWIPSWFPLNALCWLMDIIVESGHLTT